MATLRFDRRRRDKTIDALTLGEVIKRLELYESEDLRALETIAKNVLKRRLDEQEETLRRKASGESVPANFAH